MCVLRGKRRVGVGIQKKKVLGVRVAVCVCMCVCRQLHFPTVAAEQLAGTRCSVGPPPHYWPTAHL